MISLVDAHTAVCRDLDYPDNHSCKCCSIDKQIVDGIPPTQHIWPSPRIIVRILWEKCYFAIFPAHIQSTDGKLGGPGTQKSLDCDVAKNTVSPGNGEGGG